MCHKYVSDQMNQKNPEQICSGVFVMKYDNKYYNVVHMAERGAPRSLGLIVEGYTDPIFIDRYGHVCSSFGVKKSTDVESILSVGYDWVYMMDLDALRFTALSYEGAYRADISKRKIPCNWQNSISADTMDDTITNLLRS